ncbi:uncharacterized protein LOC135836934 [Planococcus citri]|uniref:uncharacterized protein LOC135836934 n=1 Tax=Planococcus citri TaxID=170843 RepID=UPI0031F944D6
MPLFFSCFLVSCSAFQYRSRFLRYFIKYPTSKMTPHRLILLVVLNLCSAISFDLELSKLPPGSFNGNVVIFYFKQNVSIICNGKSEVEWIIDTTDQVTDQGLKLLEKWSPRTNTNATYHWRSASTFQE